LKIPIRSHVRDFDLSDPSHSSIELIAADQRQTLDDFPVSLTTKPSAGMFGPYEKRGFIVLIALGGNDYRSFASSLYEPSDQD
jgi:hypothetical protein